MFIDRRADIQAFRGLAVISVILFHLDPGVFPLGYLGVDVFFVISGFVITPRIFDIFISEPNTLENRLAGLLRFYSSRVWRLAPALASTTLIFIILLFLLGPTVDQERITTQVFYTLFAIGNIGAYKSDSNYFNPNPNPFIHTWSLAIEEQIYFFIPVLSLLILTIFSRSNSYTKFLIRIYFSLITTSFIIFLFPHLEVQFGHLLGFHLINWSFFSPLTRVWQFIFGGLFYLYFNERQKKLTFMKVFTLVSLFIILISHFSFSRELSTFIVTILSGIALIFRSKKEIFSVLTHPLSLIGDRSYSIYLMHMPVIYLFKCSPNLQLPSHHFKIYLYFFAISFTFLFGTLNYQYIERRFRYTKSKTRGSFSPLLFLAIMFVPIILINSAFLYFNQVGLFEDAKFGKRSIDSLSWDGNCTFDRELVPCEYAGSRASDAILLIGDSMAGSISSTVVQLGHELNKRVYVYSKAGCPYFTNTDNVLIHGLKIDADCINHNLAIKDLIRKHNIGFIIYFQLSMNEYLYDRSHDVPTYRTDSLKLQVLNDISKLSLHPDRIAILGFTPYFDSNQLSRLDFIFGHRFNYVDRGFYSDSLWGSYSKKLGMTFVDTKQIFCPNEVCPYRIGDGWMLQDTRHLSFESSEMLLNPLKTFIIKTEKV